MESGEKQFLSDDEYKFVFSRVPRLCLDFVIVINNEVLLAKRDIEPSKGQWCLPGGMLRRKESLKEAAERILQSEIGLKPLEKKLIGFIEFPDEVNRDGMHIHSVSMVFLVKLESGKTRGSVQAQEVSFFESLPEDIHVGHGKFLKENWKCFIK